MKRLHSRTTESRTEGGERSPEEGEREAMDVLCSKELHFVGAQGTPSCFPDRWHGGVSGKDGESWWYSILFALLNSADFWLTVFTVQDM